MKTDSERRFDDFTVRQAFYKSIPVLAGYVVIGIGFGPMRRSSVLSGTVIYMMLIQVVF